MPEVQTERLNEAAVGPQYRAVVGLHHLLLRVRQAAGGYHNSSSVVVLEDDQGFEQSGRVLRFPLNVLEVLVAAALAECHVLLTGPTDCGKTAVATAVLKGLFGDGWHRLEVDSSFSEDDLMDPDLSRLGDGRLSDVVRPAAFLSRPGLLLDEVNRGHAKVLNKLLHVMDQDLTLKGGVTVGVGQPWKNGRGALQRYHWCVLTCNEGDEYVGTFAIDPALRRRAAVELPMGFFAPSAVDQGRILSAQTQPSLEPLPPVRLEDVFLVVDHAAQLPIAPTAQLFLFYLRSMDHCLHSVTRRYQGPSFCDTPQVRCCLRQVSGGLCQRVRGPTQGAWLKLVRLARALALLRGARAMALAYESEGRSGSTQERVADMRSWMKARRIDEPWTTGVFAQAYADSLCVEDRDVRAALPLLGAAKLGVDADWMQRESAFQGQGYLALQHVAGRTWSMFMGAKRAFGHVLESLSRGEALKKPALEALEEHTRTKDAWFLPALEAWSGQRLTSDEGG